MEHSSTATSLERPSTEPYRPSTVARSVAYEMALRAGRVVSWSYEPQRAQLWWSEHFVTAFNLRPGEGETEESFARRLLAPVLVAPGGAVADFAFDCTAETIDDQGVTLQVCARSIPLGQGRYELVGTIADVSERRASETALEDLVDRYRLLVELSPDAIMIHQMGLICFANPAALRFRKATHESDLVGHMITEFVDPESIGELIVRIAALTEPGDVSEPTEVRALVADGTSRLMTSTSVRTSWQGEPAFQVIMRDVTEHRAAEERFAAVVGSLSEGIMVFDAAERLTVRNDAARRILGNVVDEVGTARELFNAIRLVDEDGVALAADEHPALRTLRTGEASTNVILGLDGLAGSRRWLSINTQPLALPGEPNATAAVCSFADITEHRKTEARLQYEATHDLLTGLLNRTAVVAEVDRLLVGRSMSSSDVGLIFIDLDRFKTINDTLGHVAADEILVKVADRLVANCRAGTAIGRLGGDEFVVAVSGSYTSDAVVALAERLADAVAAPVRLNNDQEVAFTASGGVVLADAGTDDVEELLRCADAALYRAKSRGRNRVEVYDEALRKQVRQRLNLEGELRKAIASHEIFPVYQPVVDLATGAITGVEALARWHHATLGTIPPLDFIPVAEECGLISAIGEHILMKACHDFAHWRRQPGFRTMKHLAVNVSIRQLITSRVVDHVQHCLASSGLTPDVLCLEVTESVLATDIDHTRRMLFGLSELGTRLAVDDFGTGYSSLVSLKEFPVNVLKIDRSFVEAVVDDRHTAAIVRSVVHLAASLELFVIAEGIETDEQRRALVSLGCQAGQGWLLGRPAPFARLAQLTSVP